MKRMISTRPSINYGYRYRYEYRNRYRASRHRIMFHVLVSCILVHILLSPCTCRASANIDSGFTQDGKTTYCQGVRNDEGPLVFEALEVSSAGGCPIDISITIASTTIAPRTPLDVTWTASLHSGAPLATNLFPLAVDFATKKAHDVSASLLRACRAGTNCATPSAVVEPAAISGSGELLTDTGAFDPTSGKKPLRRYQFQFPTAGEDYVIVGKVVLTGGDPHLNISATEFVAFQKVHVGSETEPETTPAIIQPADVRANDAPSAPLTGAVTTTTSPPVKSPAQNHDSVSSTATSTTSGGMGVDVHIVTMVGVAGVVVVLLVVGYAVIVHRENMKRSAAKRQDSLAFSFEDNERHNTGGGTTSNSTGGGGSGGGRGRDGGETVLVVIRDPSNRRTVTTHKPVSSQPAEPEEISTDLVPVAVHKPPRSSNKKRALPPASLPPVAAPAQPPPRSQRPPSWLLVSHPIDEQASYHPTTAPHPHPARHTTRSSDLTLQYSTSCESTFSLGEPASLSSSFEHVGALAAASTVGSTVAPHFGRRSSVVLLESSTMGSDASSLGSLHDDSVDHITPISRRTASIDFDVDEDEGEEFALRDDSSIVLVSSSYLESELSGSLFRPSHRLFSETIPHSAHGSSPSSRCSSPLGSSAYFLRDTTEYNAHFTTPNRDSESSDASDEWVRRTADGQYMI